MPEPSTYRVAVGAVERLQLPEWIGALDEQDRYLTARVREILEESMDVGDRWDVDLFIPNPSVAAIFRRLTDGFRAMSSVGVAEAQMGSILLNCELPRLDRLTLTDIVSLRDDSIAFAGWRQQLREQCPGPFTTTLRMVVSTNKSFSVWLSKNLHRARPRLMMRLNSHTTSHL